ncbi:FAD-containing oxidoreductase [Variovorax sp. HJSM1_2]|uniref:FAD-containing oxidoreductase n=1 Tax=Variovorax sp. HJSM1_2 TaxID=3366263 RepID=UPI003BE99730
MSAPQVFDAIIIGAGQAGPSLAGRLTAAGQRVALIERKLFGGTCVNTGCMPTKTLVACARAAHVARHAADYGVLLQCGGGSVAMDMAVVAARRDAVIHNARNGVEGWLKGMDGCSVFQGHARFESAHSVCVASAGAEVVLQAKQIFINVGGRANVPDLPGVREVPYLDNTSMLALDSLPQHLVIVGGSYIGLEFAQIYRRFGSEVTVIEKGPRLIAREDTEVSDAVRDILAAEGIQFRLGAECIKFRKDGTHIAVGVDCTQGAPEVVGSHLLLAMGRRPNTDDLQLDRAGVALDTRGYITVDEQLRTNVPGIWALGDCNGRGAFTHTAYNDYEIVADNLLEGAQRKLSNRVDGYALFIDPPLGRAGMTVAQATKAGHKILVGRRPMTRIGRAVERGETQGFMQVVVDANTLAILGAAFLGVEGDEAIHGILDHMHTKLPYTVLQQAVPVHPTVSELIPTLLTELKPL